MVSRRRRFTREFKIETVRLLTGSDQSVAGVAEDLEIHPNTLYKWIHQYGENPKEAFPGKGKLKASDEELRRLKRKLERVTEERDILKKALAYFAEDQK